MIQVKCKSIESVAVASLKAMLVQAQGLDIMMAPLTTTLGRSEIGGEMCEVIEEIANVYLDLADRIANARAVREPADRGAQDAIILKGFADYA